jgi:hypothetical protein
MHEYHEDTRRGEDFQQRGTKDLSTKNMGDLDIAKVFSQFRATQILTTRLEPAGPLWRDRGFEPLDPWRGSRSIG